MREGDIKRGRTDKYIRPRFVIWENVAGAFTSNGGKDFRAVLEEFCRIKESGISIPMPDGGKWAHSGAIIGDGFSIAWRLMDAQYYGVPQRRKRISLLVDYGGYNATDILLSGEPFVGDITDGRFGKVLPVGESLRGNTTQSKKERQGAARGFGKGADGSDSTFRTAFGLGRDSFNSGTNAQYSMSIEEETQPPITERGAGGVCSIAQGNRETSYENVSQAWDGSQISSTLTRKNAGGEQRMPDKNNFNAV